MKSRKPSVPYLIWMVAFTLIPLVTIVYYAFTDKNGSFSFEPFINAFFYSDIFLRSLWIAFVSCVICIILAYPMAYIMSRRSERVQNLFVMLVTIPMWMNFLLRIYAWVILLQNNGPIDTALSMLGIHIELMNNAGAVVLGMVYEFLPFMILPIYTVMSKIDNRLIEAAQDLGSNGFHVFKRVVLPLSVPGIISGITMVFVPSASTFLVAQYLGGTDNIMIGDIIDKIFWTDQNTGSAISLLLMAAILIFLIVMNLFGDEEAIS